MESKGSSSLLCCLVLILLGFIRDTRQLNITSVNIPTLVRAGETDYVILDCDYNDFEQDQTKKALAVKWFYDKHDLVYQWLYGSKPQAVEPIQKFIDLDYKASDDPYTEYRAMKLNNPDIDLSGEYTCVVFTPADEVSARGSMTVYSTEEKFDLKCKKISAGDKEGMEITCRAEGLYPQPTLEISVEGYEGQKSNVEITQRTDKRYDALSRMTIVDEELPKPAIVKCSLSIPEARYNISTESVYYTGTPTTAPTATTNLMRKLEIQALNNSDTTSDNERAGGFGGDSAAENVQLDIILVVTQLLFLVTISF